MSKLEEILDQKKESKNENIIELEKAKKTIRKLLQKKLLNDENSENELKDYLIKRNLTENQVLNLISNVKKEWFSEIKWSQARNGILIIVFLHLIFEIFSGNEKTMILSVMVNYWVSRWFIIRKLNNRTLEDISENELNYAFKLGIIVPCVVFILRILLSFLYMLYAHGRHTSTVRRVLCPWLA